MTNCGYCDYLKKMTSVETSKISEATKCTFTDYIFMADMEKSDMEYPCRDLTYQEYLNSKKNEKNLSVVESKDWKFAYKSKHPIPERIRSNIAV